jgi:hypothetical protein
VQSTIQSTRFDVRNMFFPLKREGKTLVSAEHRRFSI